MNGVELRARRRRCSAEREGRDSALQRVAPAPSGSVALDQHADHAERMAAQRERILVAGRQLADAEQADQRLELVGQRDGHADRRCAAARRRRSAACSGPRSRSRPRRPRRRGARSSRPSCPAARGTRRPCRSAGRPWRAARRGRRSRRASRRRAARRSRARSRARARRARPACRACRGRPPCRAPARATRASSCGPGRRRTWRRPGAAARRARCLRSRGSDRPAGCC